MDPISALFTVGGMGMSIAGGIMGMGASANINSAQQSILADEQQENNIRQQAVTMQYQRQSIQNMRNAQMAGAKARAAGVQSGAQFGSGSVAGVQSAKSQGNWNQEGLNDSFQSANQMFAVDAGINSLKQQIGNYQTSLNNAQALSSFGGALMGGAKAAGNLSQSFGGGGGSGGGGSWNNPTQIGSLY